MKPKLLRVASKLEDQVISPSLTSATSPRFSRQSLCAFLGSRNSPSFKAFCTYPSLYLQCLARARLQPRCLPV